MQAAFNTMLGEEFLFRGVLLPRMESVFGRWSWVANGVLFGLYHVHQPWGIPNSVLTGLLYTYPTHRYRSTWMSIILHSAQSVYFSLLGARGRVGAGLGPRRDAQHGALAEVRDLGSRTYLVINAEPRQQVPVIRPAYAASIGK
ncbi:MAG TPA: CPBP family intramembrane glutamic endopeptidase [Rubrobacter sp.]